MTLRLDVVYRHSSPSSDSDHSAPSSSTSSSSSSSSESEDDSKRQSKHKKSKRSDSPDEESNQTKKLKKKKKSKKTSKAKKKKEKTEKKDRSKKKTKQSKHVVNDPKKLSTWDAQFLSRWALQIVGPEPASKLQQGNVTGSIIAGITSPEQLSEWFSISSTPAKLLFHQVQKLHNREIGQIAKKKSISVASGWPGMQGEDGARMLSPHDYAKNDRFSARATSKLVQTPYHS